MSDKNIDNCEQLCNRSNNCEVELLLKIDSLTRQNKILSDKQLSLEEKYSNLAEQYAELEKIYYDTQSYTNGIRNNPQWLGRRAVLKAFVKSFCPSLLFRILRKSAKAFRKARKYLLRFVSNYDLWIKHSKGRIKMHEALEENPLISILVPLYNTDKKMLCDMLNSCIAQTYSNFEVCLADASDSQHGYVYDIAFEYSKKDSRIKTVKLEQNLGISENTNACRKLASGEYIALLDHDDLLLPHALYSIARAINSTKCDVFYSDEDHLCNGKRRKPFFKPDFNRDLLYCQMYICHLLCFKSELFDRIGGMRDNFCGSQDYDFMLRLTEVTEKIHHIPDVLYSWRETAASTAVNPDSKPYAHEAGRKALDAHLKRRYGDKAYAADGPYTFVYDARFPLPEKELKISIIIPTKDHSELLDDCVNSILDISEYTNYEVIILDNRSEQAKTFDCFNKLCQKDPRIR